MFSRWEDNLLTPEWLGLISFLPNNRKQFVMNINENMKNKQNKIVKGHGPKQDYKNEYAVTVQDVKK